MREEAVARAARQAGGEPLPPDGAGREVRYSTHMHAIEYALANGYEVDVEEGLVYGLSGRALAIKIRGTQTHPTCSLRTAGLTKPFYAVPYHKVVAYAIWGRAAFAPGIHVRHLDGDVLNNRRANLALGTPKQNSQDIPPERRRAIWGKMAQKPGTRGNGAALTDEQAAWVGEMMRTPGFVTPTGRARPGVVRDLSRALGVDKRVVSRAVRAALSGRH